MNITANEEFSDPIKALATLIAIIMAIPGAIKSAWERRQELAPVWGRYFLAFMLGALCAVLILRGQHASVTRDEPVITQADRRAAAVEEPVETPVEEPVDLEAQAAAIEAAAVQREAQYMARVLYGTARNHSVEAQRAVCWLIINRVESSLFPNSVEEVCAQPVQWMGYASDNPVTQDLYAVAMEVLDAWHSGGIRMFSQDYLYLSWSEKEIVLRTSFNETSRTRYWHVAN